MRRLFQLIVVVTLLIGSTIKIFPAAAAPTITVAPIWHPGTQLTTLIGAGGDPYPRYVDAEVWATSNSPIWSVQLACTVAPGVLTSYTQDMNSSTADPGDDIPMVHWGPIWGTSGSQFYQIDSAFNQTTGVLTSAAARLGNVAPIGNLGSPQTFLVATFHYLVKTTAGTSPFSCTTGFLDSDGHSVATATYTAPAPLNIIMGYTISGTVYYQGRSTMSGIGINCFDDNSQFKTTTDVKGKFSITTRSKSTYLCRYFGNTSSTATTYHADIYPFVNVDFTLPTQSYTFLPVMLKGGNVDQITPIPAGDTPNQIDMSDLTRITANYNVKTNLGDVNGDGNTNQSDLSIVAGNYGFSAGSSISHVLFGLPRSSLGNPGPDNRIWLGLMNSRIDFNGQVTQIDSNSTNRDFWPMLSPDGTKIVFTRQVGAKFSLFIMKADGTGATQLTPTSAPYNAYAPSWSLDGSRLAFDCAYNGGERLNNAHLCLIDVNGRNFQDWGGASIYPPAWISNTQLLYGGSCVANSLTICLLDLDNSPQVREFSSNIERQGSLSFDEPNIVPYRPGIPVLFYRVNNGIDRRIRYALLQPAAIPTIGTWGSYSHNDVRIGTFLNQVPIATDVDYYTVSTNDMMSIIEYSGTPDAPCTGTTLSSFSWNGLSLDDVEFPASWGPRTNFSVDNVYCNPSWDGDPSHPTDLWAQRNTFNWVP